MKQMGALRGIQGCFSARNCGSTGNGQRSRRGVIVTLFYASLLLVASTSSGSIYTGRDLFKLSPVPGFNKPSALVVAEGRAGGLGYTTLTVYHALLWSSTGSTSDLHPTNLPFPMFDSLVTGSNSSQQVGYGHQSVNDGQQGITHALLWSGGAGSAIDLNPTSFPIRWAYAYGVGGGQQVGGYQGTDGFGHALVWSGSESSAVDLTPTAFPTLTSSQAFGTDGVHQVGSARGTGNELAMLWSGTGTSAVTLHPVQLPGIGASRATNVRGSQAVGYGFIGNQQHAMLWTGSAASAVDLNPTNLSGFTSSTANDTNGIVQVGSGTSSTTHALRWSGTPDSTVDLQALLPLGQFTSSNATSIDAMGNIFGTATDANGIIHVVEWSVPEPSSLSVPMLGALVLLRRKRAESQSKKFDAD